MAFIVIFITVIIDHNWIAVVGADGGTTTTADIVHITTGGKQHSICLHGHHRSTDVCGGVYSYKKVMASWDEATKHYHQS